ncbi:hypothetical protein [Treponema endosymbiont of Eucomonympha sp.]|uniref:hypothetical protein n=1 Tax=Treponema endosymbiont of Eucomonympha sp. TaxID=1580831 RepID=UPI000AB1A7DE|nr:hypothetical protein [Treponema endosymbiont of Eucomonympha sp.]
MYYIEIHGIKAKPDAPRGGVFAPLAGFFASLTKFYAPLTKFYAWLAGPCE